ncbi:MAG: membrane protein insertion efficiency factor YidD [Ignavibacteria bacterium]|nr:membrane protein insertion efficiency factor YidD [Ignavibacteria bacterium]
MREVVVFILRAYQAAISPFLPPNTCRFYPTCSQYAIDAVRKYGALKGTYRAVKRVGRCHPFHPGGYDPA